MSSKSTFGRRRVHAGGDGCAPTAARGDRRSRHPPMLPELRAGTQPAAPRRAGGAQRDMRMRLVQMRHVELRTSIGMSGASS
jgi:hypothetical protein